MGFNSEIHHRHSIRLPHYDYSRPGSYFVTVCTRDRECLFGDIVDREMKLSDAGRMVKRWWLKLNGNFVNVETDVFMVMPNHFHGIIMIHNDVVGADPCVCPDPNSGAHAGAPPHTIVQWFKTMTTNEYIRRIASDHWPPFHKRFWQRNYYERVIRDEAEMYRTREYIQNNPLNWETDEENLDGT